MSTSGEAIHLLEQARTATAAAQKVVDNLIVEHDYQDVATLVSQAATALIDAAILLLQSNDEGALDMLETSDDLLDAVYDIVNSETDEE